MNQTPTSGPIRDFTPATAAPETGGHTQMAEASRDSLAAILRLADNHFSGGRLADARDCLAFALQIKPGSPALLSSFGALQFQLGEFRSAQAAFVRAIDLQPQSSDLHAKLAAACLKLGENTRFEVFIDRALELAPDNSEALKMLANYHRDASAFASAAKIYFQLLRHNPDEVDILLSLSKCFYRLGDLATTRLLLDRVLLIDPANPVATDNLAVLNPPTSESSGIISLAV